MGKPEPDLAVWRKSTFSGGNSNCVEVARAPGAVVVRDTKNPGAGHLTVPRATWHSFLDGLR